MRNLAALKDDVRGSGFSGRNVAGHWYVTCVGPLQGGQADRLGVPANSGQGMLGWASTGGAHVVRGPARLDEVRTDYMSQGDARDPDQCRRNVGQEGAYSDADSRELQFRKGESATQIDLADVVLD